MTDQDGMQISTGRMGAPDGFERSPAAKTRLIGSIVLGVVLIALGAFLLSISTNASLTGKEPWKTIILLCQIVFAAVPVLFWIYFFINYRRPNVTNNQLVIGLVCLFGMGLAGCLWGYLFIAYFAGQ